MIARIVAYFTGPVALIVAGLLLAGLLGQTWRLHTRDAELAEKTSELKTTVADNATALAKSTGVALAASEKNRKLEGELQTLKQENEDALSKERAAGVRVADALRADNKLLKLAFANYAAPGGDSAAADTLSACRDRATTLGALLDESMRVQIDGAEDAEGVAAGARSVFRYATDLRRIVDQAR